MDLRTAPPPLAQFATAFVIPTSVATKQDRTVQIGPCVYGRYPGIFVYKVYALNHAEGLRRDGTWYKYGESFATHQQAYEALLATDRVRWGDA